MESLLNPPQQIQPDELKRHWHELAAEERKPFFFALTAEEGQAFFKDLSTAEQLELIGDLPVAERFTWLRSMRLNDAADLIQKFPEDERHAVMALFDERTRRELIGLMAYAEDAAGGLMNPRYIRIRPGMTVGEAARYLSSQARGSVEIVYYAYVIAADQKLVGVISFRDLILANQDATINDTMKKNVVSVPEQMDREEVLGLFSKYNFVAIPVVDSEGRMKGIVTYDDLAEVAQQEATEDMLKVGGMEALDAPYLKVSFFEMIKKRGGWLTVLFLGEMFTASAMAFFEREIERAVVLALFIPLIISSGGNSGSQASTLIIRSLAIKEIRLRDWFRVLRREIMTAVVLGAFLGLVGLFRIVIWQHWHPIYGEHYWLVAWTVAFSLLGVVVWGTISGAMLPFILRKLGFDPASASAPFVATLVDVTGLIIYFSVAQSLLHGTLL